MAESMGSQITVILVLVHLLKASLGPQKLLILTLVLPKLDLVTFLRLPPIRLRSQFQVLAVLLVLTDNHHEAFYLVIDLAVGSMDGWFPDKQSGKPWTDDSNSAMFDFWAAKSKW